MGDLQVALEQAQVEIVELERQKTNLTRDIIGLQSKQAFLKRTTNELVEAKEVVQKEYDTRAQELNDALETVKADTAKAKVDFVAVLSQIEVAKSDLQAVEDAIFAKAAELDKQLQAKKAEIADAQKLKVSTLEELQTINSQITAEKAKLSDLTGLVKQAETDTEAEIAAIKRKIDASTAELAKLNEQIDAKAEQYEDLTQLVTQEQTKVDEFSKTKNDFLEYEKRADKALKAREMALLEGEDKIAQAIRRSGGVLDNLR